MDNANSISIFKQIAPTPYKVKQYLFHPIANPKQNYNQTSQPSSLLFTSIDYANLPQHHPFSRLPNSIIHIRLILHRPITRKRITIRTTMIPLRMRPRIRNRHTTLTNTAIINARLQIRRVHTNQRIRAINLLPASDLVVVSEIIVYDRLVDVGCGGGIAVRVGGIVAGVGAVDVLTGEEFGAGACGCGAGDVVVGVAVCGCGGTGAGVGDGDAADEEVAGFETGDVGVCVEDLVAVVADEVETAVYDVGVVEDGFVVAVVVGGASGGAADGLDGSGAGGGSGGDRCSRWGNSWCRTWGSHWWRWCCSSGSGCWWRWRCSSGRSRWWNCYCGTIDRVCWKSGYGLGIFVVGIHISAVEIAIIVVDPRNIRLGVATIRRSKAHAYAASKRVTIFHTRYQTSHSRGLKIVPRIVGGALDSVCSSIRIGVRRVWGQRAKITSSRC